MSAPLVAYYLYVLGPPSWELLRDYAALLLICLIVWFPNQASRATGRLSIGEVVRRPSPPRLVLLFAWILLLLPLCVSLYFAAA